MNEKSTGTIVDTKRHVVHQLAVTRPRPDRPDGVEATCGWFGVTPWHKFFVLETPFEEMVQVPPTLRDGIPCEPCWHCAGADLEPVVGTGFSHPTWAGTVARIEAVRDGGVYFRYADPAGEDREWFMALGEWQAFIASTGQR